MATWAGESLVRDRATDPDAFGAALAHEPSPNVPATQTTKNALRRNI